MAELNRITQPITGELSSFETYFRGILRTDIPLLNIVIRYLLRRKGKQMRPMLVMLTARLFGKPNTSTMNAAALIEILHTATLIHDDVVDDAHERRGFFSINALWKSKVSVLLGDYLLARGLLLAVNNKEFALLELVADAVKEMSEGELIQIKRSRKLSISEEEYYEIIRKKTATLIACCSACGARSMNASEKEVEKLKEFGLLLGMAFQIKDDLLDYEASGMTGKSAGNDLKEKKLTLPLISALSQASPHDRREAVRVLNNKRSNKNDFAYIVRFITVNGGINYSSEIMKQYANKARGMLADFPDTDIRQSLDSFVDYTINRGR